MSRLGSSLFVGQNEHLQMTTYLLANHSIVINLILTFPVALSL